MQAMMEMVAAMRMVLSSASDTVSALLIALGMFRKRFSACCRLSCSFLWMNMRNSMLGRRTSGVLFNGEELVLLSLVTLLVLVLGSTVEVLVVVLRSVVLAGPNTTDSLIDSRATIQGGRRGLAVEVSLASTHE